MWTCESIIQERQLIATNLGSLECSLSYPSSGTLRFALLVAGPHPYMGGTLDNNVTSAVATEAASNGGLAITFNHFGTGHSDGLPLNVAQAMQQFWVTGHAPQDETLADGTMAVWTHVRSITRAPAFACGYSFGCWCLDRNIEKIQPRGVAMISPTLRHHQLDGLLRGNVPVAVITGERDFATSHKERTDWLLQHTGITQYHCLQNAEHFFLGQEKQISQYVIHFIEEYLQ